MSGILISYVRLKNIDSTNCAGFILKTVARAVKTIYYKRKHCSVALNGDYPTLKAKLVQLTNNISFQNFLSALFN